MQILEFYSKFINKNDLCFDVGANIGQFTEVFLKLGAKVVCIEPQEKCLHRLYRSFGKNSNVVIVGKAVGELESSANLMVCEEANTISTLSDKWVREGRFSKDYKWTKTQNVSVTTLDALIQLYGLPKFCKIDVEGFEEPVLKGLTKTIPFISFEFTQEFYDTAKNCVDRLLFLGYQEFNCSFGHVPQFLFPEWMESEELFEKMDLMEDKLMWGNIYAKAVSL
jgi:FkbM family methyltransferase